MSSPALSFYYCWRELQELKHIDSLAFFFFHTAMQGITKVNADSVCIKQTIARICCEPYIAQARIQILSATRSHTRASARAAIYRQLSHEGVVSIPRGDRSFQLEVGKILRSLWKKRRAICTYESHTRLFSVSPNLSDVKMNKIGTENDLSCSVVEWGELCGMTE